MSFIEITLETTPEGSEIFMAELSEIGFSMFEEAAFGFKGYIDASEFNKSALTDVIDKYEKMFSAQFSIREIEKVNWNEAWEKNFNPIEIAGLCKVRASFHPPDPDFKYDIVINPKMTFGTGHHSTTALMLQFQLKQEYSGKEVADIGCGTGILAIMAAKLGARRVTGIEIEDWSVENARENVVINRCEGVEILQGKLSENNITSSFDIILANINKNVLLEEPSEYKKILKPGAELLLSGFYYKDIEDIEKKAAGLDIRKLEYRIQDDWAAVLFQNSEHYE